MKADFSIAPISKSEADRWVAAKHYSRRPSIFWQAFGLFEAGKLEGVVVYGQPSPPIQKHAFTSRTFRLFELSRLVIQTKTRNAASFLVGRSLAQLEAPCAVISYADSEWGHCGFVYQATNWTYTGSTVSHDHAYLIEGKRVHPITLRDRGITNPKEWAKAQGIKTVPPMPKHRYFFFVGNRSEVKKMKGLLKYPVVAQYPKCSPSRYDDGPTIRANPMDDPMF